MKQSNGQQQRMKWWNNGVKEAVRKKKVAYIYIVWLQQKIPGAKEEYLKAKREARRVVRNAQQNDEWIEMGAPLQEDFQRNQKRFWKRVASKNKSREARTYVMKMVW